MILRTLGALFEAWRKFRVLCMRHYWASRFAETGARLSIGDQFQAYGVDHIHVGDDVVLANRVTLRAMTAYPWADPPQAFEPKLVLKSGCFVNNGCQISCIDRVTIGENVMLAEYCFIADNNHSHEDPDRAIKHQPLRSAGELVIGDGSWIGANCCVIGAVRIGRHCVVGANSVVNTDLPDFSLAVGAPARVVRRYDPASRTWAKVNPSPPNCPDEA